MNSTVFNASLKEKLENLNQKTRPLPDIPCNDERGRGMKWKSLLFWPPTETMIEVKRREIQEKERN
jgi:hypothetical protein